MRSSIPKSYATYSLSVLCRYEAVFVNNSCQVSILEADFITRPEGLAARLQAVPGRVGRFGLGHSLLLCFRSSEQNTSMPQFFSIHTITGLRKYRIQMYHYGNCLLLSDIIFIYNILFLNKNDFFFNEKFQTIS